MPWSEWIQSDPYERGTFARYKAVTQSGNTAYTGGESALDVISEAQSALYSTDAVTTVYGQLAGANPGASRSEGASPDLDDVWTGGVVQTQSVAWFDTGDLELATWREWFPPEFNDLTEDVDYGLRPDRTGSEDDAFIEYEDGVGEIDHWSAFASARIVANDASYDPPRHATVRWRLLSPAPAVPAVPPTGGSTSAPPMVLLPSAGSPVAEMLNVTLVGFPSAIPVEAIVDGSVTEFAILMVTDESSDIPSSDPTDSHYTHEWGATGLPAAAAAFVRLPRWRYWIPGSSHVRLLHRGDGLGMNPRRLRTGGNTHQSGRLRGSY